MRAIIICCFILLSVNLFAQSPTQTIRGIVLEKDTRQPVIGAEVFIFNSDPLIGTATEIDGSFELTEVPVGRVEVHSRYTGFSNWSSGAIILNSAKEVVLTIELVSGIDLGEVVVKATRGNEALNELSVVSTRSFSPEETQRYAASANDPGRMAMGFPGVQASRDNRSDIVIRGNSSLGLLWRLEGVDIPNPNHFARRGSSGGGITIFSISMLGKSDFSVGAFPAEYGNAFSGVFDVKFRKGNNDSREHTFRAGLLGLDFATEGPIKKGKSSYLLNYRYSTLGILNQLGLHLVGARIDNTFQDLSFKLNFPSENKKSNFSIWGIGGLSREIGSEEKEEAWNSFSDRTTYNFTTNMGALGVAHSYLLNEKSYLKTTLAVMAQEIQVQDDTLNIALQPTNYNDEDYLNGRLSLSSIYSRELNQQLTLKAGVFASNLFYDLKQDSLSFLNFERKNIINANGNTFLLQPFIQFRYRPAPKWMINVGAHAMHLTLNGKTAVEPRIGIKFQASDRQAFALAYGMHSKILPIGSYFTQVRNNLGGFDLPNSDLEFIRAQHVILSYDLSFGKAMRFHAETYYQQLSNVPVVNDLNRTYWLLNDIQGYATEALVSEGSGTNMGIDISVEQFFSAGTFMLISGSVYDSKYTALDKSKTFNTQYNSNYSAALMGGKEWSLSATSVLQASLKVLYNGGLRITPLDLSASSINEYDPPEDEGKAFEEQIPAYFRPDFRLTYRKDTPKSAWYIALDIQNFIARRNIDGLNRVYDPELKAWAYRKQSSLVPLLSFQIDF